VVTFLVCLVVVGGAVVAILRLTLDEGRQPATDADGASRGTRGDRLATSARRASAFLVPGGSPSRGRRARVAPPRRARRPAAAVGDDMTIGSVALAEAALAREEAARAADTGTTADAEADVAAEDPLPVADAGAALAADMGTTADAEVDVAAEDPVPVAVTGAGPAPTAAPPADDPTVATSWPDDRPPEPDDLVLLDEPAPLPEAAGPDATRPGATAPGGDPTGRRARPSLSRRLLRRLRGATGLVVLLVALGALLAITLAAVTAMVVIGVRAAVGT
jgi:hypothetical protein